MGLDTELFIGGDIPEYLMCPICLEVLEDPQQMCTSQHVACDACLSKYFGNDINQKKPCPVCRQFFSWQSLVSSQILERALMTLKVKCVNSGECSWTGAYKDCEDHSKKSCRFAKVPCEKCRVEVVVNKKEEHLRSSCGEIMINCPRGGAQCGSYLRKNGPDHNRICSNYECSVDVNCHTRTTLQHLNIHEKECRLIRDQLRHSRLRISALEETLARSAVGVGENERKRKREDEGIHEAQKKIEELERIVADLRSRHVDNGSGEYVLPSLRLRLRLPNIANLAQSPAPNNRRS